MKQVLFVCIGNTCRSPMAEAFANRYGADVLIASSSGLSPVASIVPETVASMAEVGIDVSGHIPSFYDMQKASDCDVVVNMSGMQLPGGRPRNLLDWEVMDPYRRDVETFRRVRNDIEHRVMLLILKLRRESAIVP